MTLVRSAKVANKKIKPWTPGRSNSVTGMLPVTSQLILQGHHLPCKENSLGLATCIRAQIKSQPASSLKQEVTDLGMAATFHTGLGYSWSNNTIVSVEAELMNSQSLWDNHIKLGIMSWSPLGERGQTLSSSSRPSGQSRWMQDTGWKPLPSSLTECLCCFFFSFPFILHLCPLTPPFLPSHTFCLIACKYKYPERNPWTCLDPLPRALFSRFAYQKSVALTFQNTKLWKLPLALENVRHRSQMLSVYRYNLNFAAYLFMGFFFFLDKNLNHWNLAWNFKGLVPTRSYKIREVENFKAGRGLRYLNRY